jgi:hypothetical protein
MLLVPLLVAVLVRLNHQYESEAAQLGGNVDEEVKAPVPATHVTIVMIDKLDAAAARAIHFARTLRTDRTEAVHLAVDEHRAAKLIEEWERIRPDHIDLRLIDSPERKLVRTALEHVSDLVADGRTQVSVLIPRLLHRRRWHRLLHDSTGDALASALSKLEHVNVTFVPFHLGTPAEAPVPAVTGGAPTNGHTPDTATGPSIGGLVWRQPAAVTGRVTQLTIETVGGTPSLVATISDGTGELDLLFLGRSHIGGMHLGARLSASGMAAAHRGRLTIINPVYQLLPNGSAPH